MTELISYSCEKKNRQSENISENLIIICWGGAAHWAAPAQIEWSRTDIGNFPMSPKTEIVRKYPKMSSKEAILNFAATQCAPPIFWVIAQLLYPYEPYHQIITKFSGQRRIFFNIEDPQGNLIHFMGINPSHIGTIQPGTRNQTGKKFLNI